MDGQHGGGWHRSPTDLASWLGNGQTVNLVVRNEAPLIIFPQLSPVNMSSLLVINNAIKRAGIAIDDCACCFNDIVFIEQCEAKSIVNHIDAPDLKKGSNAMLII